MMGRFEQVSILSQPEGRELHPFIGQHLLTHAVSILSQPEGRELLGTPKPEVLDE